MSAIEINRATTIASTTTIIPTTAAPSLDDTTTNTPIADIPDPTTTETGSIIILYIFFNLIQKNAFDNIVIIYVAESTSAPTTSTTSTTSTSTTTTTSTSTTSTTCISKLDYDFVLWPITYISKKFKSF